MFIALCPNPLEYEPQAEGKEGQATVTLGKDLSKSEQEQLEKIAREFPEVFSKTLWVTQLTEQQIKTPMNMVTRKGLRWIPQFQEIVWEEV